MPKIRFDSLRFHPEINRAFRAMRRGKTDAIAELLEKHRKPPWEERSFVLSQLADETPLDVLDVWCRFDPTCPEAWLLRGVRRIRWAWEARGGDRASEVEEEAWEVFFQRLHSAESDLLWAAELVPEDPTPYSSLISVAMGLSQGKEAVVSHFKAATARAPEFLAAYSRATHALTEKWSGTHDDMFAVARQAAKLAKPTNDLAVVLIDAHVERWLYFDSFDEDEEGAKAYLHDREVVSEVAMLYDRTMRRGRPSKRSGSKGAFNIAAFWFYLVRDKNRLRDSLRKIDEDFREHPWAYFADPDEVIAHAYEIAGLT